MKLLSKLIFPAIVATVIVVIYFTYFAPTKEIGSFSKFSAGSEINQNINVMVVKTGGFGRDANGRIISFYAKDKNALEIRINPHEPAPEEIVNAEIVELLGHMHGNDFTAAKVSVIK